MGGANVRVLTKLAEDAKGRFNGLVKTVTLSLELPTSMTSDPRGAELFADTLIELVQRNDPFKTPRTRAGFNFESSEFEESVGMAFQKINNMSVSEIVENMARMSQSSRSPLELEDPKLTLRITYLNPPSGSGKRKFNTGDILELTAFEKKKKTDDTIEEPCCETKTMVETKQTRSNIMPNEGNKII